VTKNSLAVAIEALSWMAYSGMGERTALFKAAEQLGVAELSDLRRAHWLIMETTRFRNRLEHLVSRTVPEDEIKRAPHGVTSFLKILAYLKYVDGASDRELTRAVYWARQVLGWKELHPFEKSAALIVRGALELYPGELSESEKLALETCHPSWLVERLVRIFGRDFALRMLRRNLQSLPTYVRINTLKVREDNKMRKIMGDLRGSRVNQLLDVWSLQRAGSRLIRSRLWTSGEIVIQDLGSVTASLVASPPKGGTVLDICAAPGNKTSHLAALMQNQGEIVSIDISEKRLAHWKREMIRTGTSIAFPLRADAARIPVNRRADVVLLDPPCSNTGVFARNPSMKWRMTPSRVRDLTIKQYAFLESASEHVSLNGVLVYCTCSVLPEENEHVLESFLRKRMNFRVEPQSPFFGSPGLRGLDQCQRFYSHIHNCNGYFIAKLRRID